MVHRAIACKVDQLAFSWELNEPEAAKINARREEKTPRCITASL